MRRTDFLRVVRKQVPSTDVEESQRVDVVSTAKSVNKAVWNAVRSKVTGSNKLQMETRCC